jgi:polysaccharide deacetylase 2 family uncharacterized protein YibQ
VGWIFSDPTSRDAGEPSVLQPLEPAPPPPVTAEEVEKMMAPATQAQAGEPIGLMALKPAPDRALLEQGADGPLPVIGTDGHRAWQIYARPFNGAAGRAKVAIYVGGIGLGRQATETALAKLPGQVSLGLATGLNAALQPLINAARAKGHEVLIELPMEPADFPINDPGPYTMLTTNPPNENVGRLEWLMSRGAGYVGMAATLGDRFMTDESSLRPVLEALSGRGLMILDTRGLPRSVVARVADAVGLPFGVGTVTIDDDPQPSAIEAKLAHLEELARLQGGVIGVGHAYPVTVDSLDKWSRGLEARNMQFAPVTALLTGGGH